MVNTMDKNSVHISSKGMGFLVPVTRKCLTSFDALLAQHATEEFRDRAGARVDGVYHVDLLQIDVECQDFEILKLINFATFQPEHIQYEALDCMGEGKAKAVELLKSHGYEVFPPSPGSPGKDVYARRKVVAPTSV